MAGNTRGKIKEHYEGIHRNLDWILDHCNKVVALVGDEKHKVSKATIALGKLAKQIDDMAQKIYNTI